MPGATIGGIRAAIFNPIRWKSQYYDDQEQLYYIDGRYYSPAIRQFLSPESPESMMSSAGVINGLYAYALTLDNPVNMSYNGHTIAPNGELAFDPPESGRWSMLGRRMMRRAGRFFGTPEGQLTAAFIYVAAIIKTWGKATPLILMSTGAGAWISGTQAGNRARDSGDSYWDGFTGYITDNWAQSAAITIWAEGIMTQG